MRLFSFFVSAFNPKASYRSFLLQQQNEQKALVKEEILAQSCEGLVVKDAGRCGKGLFATKMFLEGDYICVYTGQVITKKKFEERYGDVSSDRCYTFHFAYDTTQYVIDATDEHESFARMANHSWKKFNAKVSRQVVKGEPYLVMTATKDIRPGHEIRYNYGDEVVKESGHLYAWLSEVVDYN